MLRNIYGDYGPEYTSHLLGMISKLGIAVLLRRGFSIGIGDLDLMENTSDEIISVIEDSVDSANQLIDDFYSGALQALPGRTTAETLEVRLVEVLNRARNKSGDAAMRQIRENSALVMARSGARGNVLNIAQMTAIVGQQALRGKRIEKGFKEEVEHYLSIRCYKKIVYFFYRKVFYYTHY